jgi:hypothetical protein
MACKENFLQTRKLRWGYLPGDLLKNGAMQ